ncbi:hypothetical protein [Paenibacillus hexagrammi]|uniref:Butirosin biosynthesis protein H N-terminal domain-containing protein n=1 Tax=Paenibacillus hexagrammi TaxID=2908839 RepID=A0ABY3SKX3_9BACL|nr:hypothetical protein [Paenibacillus sp. YPD9-1]UJF34503.1 hypothetical protein L0M14_04770 [Paenibacillus sp. YPD9-1]
MNIQLPVQIPPMKCWQFSAFPLAILLNHEQSLEWMFSSFIQVSGHTNFLTHPVPFGFYEVDYAYNPWLKVHRLDRSLMPVFRTSIKELVIDCLKRGYYLYLNLDEFYVPNRVPYQKFNRSHDVLVYGFDEEEELFHLLGYNERLIFDKTTISFAEFEQAYHSLEEVPNYCHQIYLYQFNEKGAFTFDIELVIQSLKEYLYSRNTAAKYKLLAEPEPTFLFGMQTYEILQGYMEHLIGSPDGYVDLRYMHMLWEHKHWMTRRVQFLIEKGYLQPGADLLEKASHIEKSSESARNMLIKFYRSRNTANVHAVKQILEQIRQSESLFVEQLIEALSLPEVYYERKAEGM